MDNILYYKVINSPVGRLQIIASDNALVAVYPQKYFSEAGDELVENDNHPILLETEKQLGEYFSGKRKEFDLKLDMRGTVFQINAWRQLQKIPYGETISYGEQAKRIGDSKKARAVGAANGRNPFLIVVPCHRVIGASGALTGFGGGLDMKKKLLELENS
jgi:methylated-DNA-[protein]-cysteine S-methyltransferase